MSLNDLMPVFQTAEPYKANDLPIATCQSAINLCLNKVASNEKNGNNTFQGKQ